MRFWLACSASLLLLLSCGPGGPAPRLVAPELGPEREITRIAMGSCAEQTQPQPIWDAIAAAQPELFLFLGDNVYGSSADRTLAGAYETQEAIPGFARFRREVPLLGTWDDHDYGVNDGGAEHVDKVEAKEMHHNFFRTPADAPVRRREGVYDVHTFGPPGRRVQIVFLDTRWFRSPLIRRPGGDHSILGRYLRNDDPNGTMLGETQWEWLAQVLTEPAELRVVVSSVQLIPDGHGWEKWGNLPRERQRFFELLKEGDVAGVVLVSGDRHLAEISRLGVDEPLSVGYPLVEMTASGLNVIQGGRDDEVNEHRLGSNFREANFGWIEIDWSAPEPSVLLEIRDLDGIPRLSHRLRLADLQAAG